MDVKYKLRMLEQRLYDPLVDREKKDAARHALEGIRDHAKWYRLCLRMKIDDILRGYDSQILRVSSQREDDDSDPKACERGRF